MKSTEAYPSDFAWLENLESLPFEIGGFVLLELLSSNQAVVFRARQQHPSREVVLKFPRAEFGRANLERFRTEYALAARVRHSAIVPILEVGEIEGYPYYSMPFIEGHTLLDHVDHAQLSLAERERLFHRICEVVAVLHREGLIHRDLKSQNILIDRYGEVALLDFGLAIHLQESAESRRASRVEGTIRYMSPEQASGVCVSELGPRSDVFALGVIGYRLLTELFPFDLPEAKSLALERVAACPVNLAPLLQSRASDNCKEAIQIALQRDPEQRFSDASSMLASLGAQRSPGSPGGHYIRGRPDWRVPIRLTLIALGATLLLIGAWDVMR